MATTFPGTTIETCSLKKGSSKQMFDGIFAAGGITLSQVSILSGLEYYLIQNWVKRGFVSSPVKRVYSREQFARIIIINMLRDTLPIEKISSLIHIIGGDPNDRSDDLIGDDELYHRYVDLAAEAGGKVITDPEAILAAVERSASSYDEPIPGARKRLIKILQVMAFAHFASVSRRAAEEILSKLD